MKKTLSILLSIALALSLFSFMGCAAPQAAVQSPGESKLNIVATIFPPYDFARALAQEHANITLLLPPGAESHSFEPTPKDILAIQSCDIFLMIGGPSEAWAQKIIDGVDAKSVRVVKLIDCIEQKLEEEHDEDDHDHEESEGPIYDEHIWTSPRNAMRMTTAIADALIAADPANVSGYQANLEAYNASLKELDDTFTTIAKEAKRNTLVFGDRFPLRYFADAYGFDCHSAYPGCAVEAEPSAATVANLSALVRDEKIPVVFYLELSNQLMADTLIEGTSAKKLLFHSCHNLSKSEFESGATYLLLMRQNAQNVKEAVS